MLIKMKNINPKLLKRYFKLFKCTPLRHECSSHPLEMAWKDLCLSPGIHSTSGMFQKQHTEEEMQYIVNTKNCF